MLKRLALAGTFLCLAAGVAFGIHEMFTPHIVPMHVTYRIVQATIVPPLVEAPVPPAPDKEQPKFNLVPPSPGQHTAAFHRSYAQSAAPGTPGKALTARAGHGPDAFGLGVGDGSGDTIGGQGGSGGNGGGAPWTGTDNAFNGALAQELRQALLRDQDTATGIYTLVVRTWLDPDGHIRRAEIETSSGDAALDRAVTRVLQSTTVSHRPPQGLDQPVRVRLTARRA
jgi:TonB family protein